MPQGENWGPPPEEFEFPPPPEDWDSVPPEDPANYYDQGDVPTAPYEDEPAMLDEPPFDESMPRSQRSRANNRSERSRKDSVEVPEELANQVMHCMRSVFAALHRRPTSDCIPIIVSIKTDDKVLNILDEDALKTYASVFDVMELHCVNTPGGVLDLEHLPVMDVIGLGSPDAKAEFAAIRALIGKGDSDSAAALWQALREKVQRHYSRTAMQKALDLHLSDATTEALMAGFKEVVAQPPTAKKALTTNKPVRTADEIDAEHTALTAAAPTKRWSSGYRTLDLVFTGTDQPIGFLAPGEQCVVAGMTGTGKSSFSYGLVVGMTQDMINWGFPDGYILWYHTEEESQDKAHAAGLASGDRYHHLAKNVVIDAVGTSRKRMCEVIYLLTQKAGRLAEETGRPIDQFLPHVALIDYIQSLTSEKAQDPVKESIITAELILRGFQAWNFEEMAKWGEISYQEYIGESLPPGMEHHRMAVVTFAQLNKQDDRLMAYKPGSKDHPLTDFTLEDGSNKPGWVTEGGNWTWEVKEGDARILRQNAISGSSVILKNATTILFLHRSRPYNNPEAKGADGKPTGHLQDVRARLVPDKTRTGSRKNYVPMAFDIDENGFRARYYDRQAEKAIERGLITPDSSWSQPGDPILPIRSRPRPLAGVVY